MRIVNRLVGRFHGQDEGVTAIEYALLAALIAVAIILGASALGGNINTSFSNIATHVK